MTGEDTQEPHAPAVAEVASAFVDGQVGADQAAWVAANMGADPALAADVEGFGRVKGLLGALPVATPAPGGWDAIDAGVRRGVAAESRRTWVARISAAAAAVVLVAAIVVGAVVVAGRSTPEPAPQATPAVLAPPPTRAAPSRPGTGGGTGAVAAARGIGSVVERVGVGPRPGRSTTSTTSTRPPVSAFVPSR